MRAERSTVLRLRVRNHPGVLSHVSGLFARRGFNVDGVLCLALGDRVCSAVLLLVAEDQRLPQVVAQLRKLEDVLEVHVDPEARPAFDAAGRWAAADRTSTRAAGRSGGAPG